MLRKIVNNHVSLSFPAHPDNNELEDWLLELAEFDGHYVGIATSVLNGKNNKQIDLSDLNIMKERLKNISVESNKDKKIANDCELYLKSLEKIIYEINKDIG